MDPRLAQNLYWPDFVQVYVHKILDSFVQKFADQSLVVHLETLFRISKMFPQRTNFHVTCLELFYRNLGFKNIFSGLIYKLRFKLQTTL